MKYQNHNVTRVQKAIDELIKICDSGKATGEIRHILDQLRELQSYYELQE